MCSLTSRLIAALLVGLGIAVASVSVSHGLQRFRMSDRSVTVKGLAEKEVQSDFAVWTLSFRRAGNDFGGVQLGGEGEEHSGLRFQLRGFNDVKAPLLAEATRNAPHCC